MAVLDLGKVVPEKGVDYYTNTDKAEMVAETKAQVLEEIVIPTKTSDLTNDSGFIDNSVNNLVNYYKKTETYTKAEVDSKVSSVYKYKGSVATFGDLPSTGQVIGDVYNVESDGSNYAWNGTIWDKLGGEIDLSDYYTKSQTDILLSGKVGFTDYATDSNSGVFKTSTNVANSVNANGVLIASIKTYSNYSSGSDAMFISKGTLENVITGKELTNKTYVDGLVGDIATALDEIQREVI